MEDGRGPATSLREAILRFWDIPDATGMLGKIYPARDTARLASLSGIVFEEARVGDRVARELVEYAAGEVALCVAAVAKRLELPGNRLPLALTGGILVNQPEFREAVLRRLAEGFELSQVEVVAEPALSGARAAIHLPVTD